jgi:hypothetical protein
MGSTEYHAELYSVLTPRATTAITTTTSTITTTTTTISSHDILLLLLHARQLLNVSVSCKCRLGPADRGRNPLLSSVPPVPLSVVLSESG